MDFRFTPQEEEFRKQVREFLDRELTPELLEELGNLSYEGELARQFALKVGAEGWLAAGWPKEYGGQGRPVTERYILREELAFRGVDIPYRTAVGMVGPALMLHGSEEQKREYLPRIASGEISFTLGYTEPNAGTDLAALQTRALEDGDDYIINGQKVFSGGAHFFQYTWLAARTDPNAPKHKGISLFIVDNKSPGLIIRPLYTMDGGRTNEVFWDNVRVPKKNIVGEKNKGWYIIATALDFERLIIWVVADLRPAFDGMLQYVQETKAGGVLLTKHPQVRHKLAQLAIELEVGRLINLRAVWMVNQGIVPYYEASMMKVYITELEQHVANVGMEILGLYGQLQKGSKWAPLQGRIERLSRHSMLGTFAGGCNEIQRDIIATRGLGLPR